MVWCGCGVGCYTAYRTLFLSQHQPPPYLTARHTPHVTHTPHRIVHTTPPHYTHQTSDKPRGHLDEDSLLSPHTARIKVVNWEHTRFIHPNKRTKPSAYANLVNQLVRGALCGALVWECSVWECSVCVCVQMCVKCAHVCAVFRCSLSLPRHTILPHTAWHFTSPHYNTLHSTSSLEAREIPPQAARRRLMTHTRTHRTSPLRPLKTTSTTTTNVCVRWYVWLRPRR